MDGADTEVTGGRPRSWIPAGVAVGVFVIPATMLAVSTGFVSEPSPMDPVWWFLPLGVIGYWGIFIIWARDRKGT